MSFIYRKIRSNTIGALLCQTRKSIGWDLKDVEKKTGISVRNLEILENNDFHKFPNLVYARGSLERYSEFLHLDKKQIIKRFKQESIQSKISHHIAKSSRLDISRVIRFVSHNAKIIVFLIILVLILFYLGFSIKGVLFGPQIQIITPQNDLVTKESSLTIEGEVEIGVDIFINNQAVSQMTKGYFKQKIELLPGLNTIEVSGKKKYSRKEIIYLRVILEE